MATTFPEAPVLVVGAGPTGLTAALELARRGIACRVVERRPTPSGLSRAVGILPNTMRLLGPSGAAAELAREAIRARRLEIWIGDGVAARIPLDRHPDPEIGLFCLPQDRTEAILAGHARRFGATVEYGCAFESLVQRSDGVEATVAGAARRYCQVLGADGAGSAVRQAVGVPWEGIELAGDWSIADVEAPGWTDAPGVVRVFLGDAGGVGIAIPLAETRYRIVAMAADAVAALPVAVPVTRLHRAGRFRVEVRQAARYREGDVFLAGDAAHCHSPVGGRGMNLGIADAAFFAECLAAGRLEEYSRIRWRAGRETIESTERARKLVAAPMTAVRRGVLRLLDLAARVPGVPRRLAERLFSDRL